jgi:4'-phosphopantetheinyl transferase
VWLLDLDPGAGLLDGARAFLSTDERRRAERFRFERDRERFVAGRVQLRLLLGRYLGQPADAVQFAYGPRGKPSLRGPAGGIEFNLAHSGEAGLVAVGRECDIGVDIESTVRDVAVKEVAERFFSPEELTALEELTGENRRAGFFRCWTRKEAFLKATGVGLAFGLDRFSVSLGAEAKVSQIMGDRGGASRWSLSHLEPAPDYVGAVALRSAYGEIGFDSPFCLRFLPS